MIRGKDTKFGHLYKTKKYADANEMNKRYVIISPSKNVLKVTPLHYMQRIEVVDTKGDFMSTTSIKYD